MLQFEQEYTVHVAACSGIVLGAMESEPGKNVKPYDLVPNNGQAPIPAVPFSTLYTCLKHHNRQGL
jgi:hypothetical protein